MESLYDLSWRILPASLIAAAGAFLIARALVRASSLPRTDAIHKAGVLMMSLRLLIAGLSFVAFGAGWAWHQVWLIVLALAFFGEEMLETSMALAALRQSERVQERARVAAAGRRG